MISTVIGLLPPLSPNILDAPIFWLSPNIFYKSTPVISRLYSSCLPLKTRYEFPLLPKPDELLTSLMNSSSLVVCNKRLGAIDKTHVKRNLLNLSELSHQLRSFPQINSHKSHMSTIQFF